MANFWEMVNRVIWDADILIEVLDARLVEESRNQEIEDKVRKADKVLIYVINKCDLVKKYDMEKIKKTLHPCVFISAKEHLGTSYLREEILKHAPSGKFKVGVLGYPNTGKSSVINVLKGKTTAKVAPMSGQTRGLQKVKISARMYLIDTPGVFPYMEKNDSKHAAIAARTFGNLKDPESSAEELISMFPEKICRYYDVKKNADSQLVLEEIAHKLGKIKKGKIADTNAAARIVLSDWQRGKIAIDLKAGSGKIRSEQARNKSGN